MKEDDLREREGTMKDRLIDVRGPGRVGLVTELDILRAYADACRQGAIAPEDDPHISAHMTSDPVTVEGEAFVNTDADPNGYSGGVIPLIADFITDHGIEASVADAWAGELRGLSKSGDYYFTVTKFAFSGMNPH